jgi:hypothetical protein
VDEFYKRSRQDGGAGHERRFHGKAKSETLPAPHCGCFQELGAYTIEINTLEAASYHKHIHF